VTPAQRAALDALPPKRRAFVLAFTAEGGGNATAAARSAGYAKPTVEGSRLLRIANVWAAVEALRIPAEDAKVLSIDALRELWTKWAHDDDAKRADQLKATEHLAKSLGAFVDRTEVSGPAGSPLQFTIAGDDVARLEDLVRTKGKR
jgi:phage terminase small subunit